MSSFSQRDQEVRTKLANKLAFAELDHAQKQNKSLQVQGEDKLHLLN